MQPSTVEHVAVIGAGLMGTGIAQVFAMAGYPVSLSDSSPEALQRAIPAIEENLRLLAGVGAIPAADIPSIVQRVKPCAVLREAIGDADLVIESVREDLALKLEVFGQLAAHSPQHALLCTNSSSIMPSQLAPATQRPENVAGLHFFNPAALTPLVEVIPGDATSPQVTETLAGVLRKAGKRPVVLRKQAPGFLANRLQAALVREAVSLVDRGVASPDEIDEVIRYGLSQRWSAAGVFELLDLAGLDTALAASSLILPDLDSSTEAASLQERVARGQLGAKTGRGFLSWTPDRVLEVKKRVAGALMRG
jgi:3-hydroxybutyryl-CoA dehydrogenase